MTNIKTDMQVCPKIKPYGGIARTHKLFTNRLLKFTATSNHIQTKGCIPKLGFNINTDSLFNLCRSCEAILKFNIRYFRKGKLVAASTSELPIENQFHYPHQLLLCVCIYIIAKKGKHETRILEI